MIVDTSALLAILLTEAEARPFSLAISDDRTRLLSTASYVEAGLKLVRLGLNAMERLDKAVVDLRLTLVDVTAEHAREAVRARERFGRAPARLNFGDCLVYALAKSTGEPLLFKGDDFAHADVARVL